VQSGENGWGANYRVKILKKKKKISGGQKNNFGGIN
jgi:hypothetical protein